MKNVSICVVGAGEWGKNHIRTLSDLNVLGGVIDTNYEQIQKIKKLFPDVNYFDSLESGFQSDYDGYIVATPPKTHATIVKKILQKRKPVLVEKPLALSVKEAKDIETTLIKLNGKLLVGHLLLFHPAILKMKEIIDNGLIGKVQYMYSNRLKFGKIREEENVLWSFAPHDIALFQFFSDSFPIELQSSGGAFILKNIYDSTITYLKYPNGIKGHIFVNWIHPFKEHRLVIIGSKGTLHFEDSAKNNPLLFYQKDTSEKNGILTVKNKLKRKIDYNPELPLVNEIKYFVDVINGNSIEKANIQNGIDVVKILEMATKSLNN